MLAKQAANTPAAIPAIDPEDFCYFVEGQKAEGNNTSHGAALNANTFSAASLVNAGMRRVRPRVGVERGAGTIPAEIWAVTQLVSPRRRLRPPGLCRALVPRAATVRLNPNSLERRGA